MSSIRFLAAGLWLLAVQACGGTDKPQGDANYFPHSDGFTWTYRYSRDGGTPGMAVARIEGTEQVGGVTAQRLTLASDLASGAVLGQVRSDVLRLHGAALFGQTLAFDPPLDLLGLPFEPGDRFRADTRFPVAVLEVRAQVETRVAGFGPVAAGGRRYEDAFRLESTVSFSAVGVSVQSSVTVWLAPELGAVRAEAELPQNPLFPVSGRLSAELLNAGQPPAHPVPVCGAASWGR
jgi:hypothetical protein